MKISTKIIKELNPCCERFDNYLEYYRNFEGNLNEFLALDKISYDDKVWVFTRIAIKAQNVKWAALCAESVLLNFEKKYPNDRRPFLAIKAAAAADITRAAAYAAYTAAVDAAAAAAYAAYTAAVDAAAAAYAAYTAARAAAAAAYAAYTAAVAAAAAAYAAYTAARAAAAAAAATYATAAAARATAAACAADYAVDVHTDTAAKVKQQNINLQLMLEAIK